VLGAGDRRIAAVAVACPMEELYFVVGRHRSVHRSQQILPLPPHVGNFILAVQCFTSV
jgi:hypothetical protein